MKTFVAFLRGINVGGNNVLPMKELVSLCTQLGLKDVRTYIQSGNIIFGSEKKEADIVALLRHALHKTIGNDITVVVRSPIELKNILAANPFKEAEPSHVGVLLLESPATKEQLARVQNIGPEEVVLGNREVYVHYPLGMGKTKLKLPKELLAGTVRNINTITKLVALCKS